MEFSGCLGGLNSQLGGFIAGYDALNELFAVWERNRNVDDYTVKMNFGVDERVNRIILLPNTLTVLRREHFLQAQQSDAVVLGVGRNAR